MMPSTTAFPMTSVTSSTLVSGADGSGSFVGIGPTIRTPPRPAKSMRKESSVMTKMTAIGNGNLRRRACPQHFTSFAKSITAVFTIAMTHVAHCAVWATLAAR
jgi:hypothetical protein